MRTLASFALGCLVAALILIAHGETTEHWTDTRAGLPGCVGDFISTGLYCHWIDSEGNHIVTRAY